MKININQMVSVELTATGADIYNKWDRENTYKGWSPKNLKEGAVIRDQLWGLFQKFGSGIDLGAPEAPFKNCSISIIGALV